MSGESVVLPDGRTVAVRPVGFSELSNDFSEYLTDDQTLVRIKHVVTKILELDELDEFGNRRYVVHTQAVVVTHESRNF